MVDHPQAFKPRPHTHIHTHRHIGPQQSCHLLSIIQQAGLLPSDLAVSWPTIGVSYYIIWLLMYYRLLGPKRCPSS